MPYITHISNPDDATEQTIAQAELEAYIEAQAQAIFPYTPTPLCFLGALMLTRALFVLVFVLVGTGLQILIH
jgi:hypothetical protein